MSDTKQQVEEDQLEEDPKATAEPEGEEREETLKSEDNDDVTLDENGQPVDSEKMREIRRQKRLRTKEKRREAMMRDKARIANLERQLEELQGKAQVFEKRVGNQDIAQIDAGISQLKDYIARANEAYALAIKEGNGEAAATADEGRYEARRRLDALTNAKQQMARAMQTRQNQPPQLDPRVVSQAQGWMARNRWYSPQGDDEDSAIALVIEKRLNGEGFDPSSPEYWSELDRRIAKRLPHRASGAPESDDDDDDDYEAPPPRKASPRSPVAGGSKTSHTGGSGDGKGVTLPADYVQQLKEAGLWDDPKKRKEMIARFQQSKAKYA